jgi:hypothetical protein
MLIYNIKNFGGLFKSSGYWLLIKPVGKTKEACASLSLLTRLAQIYDIAILDDLFRE